MKLSISSIGLNKHEQALLVQQLKMLRGRTNAIWEYILHADQADLVFRFDPAQNIFSALALKPSGEVKCPIRIEWPLRLFGVMELLAWCEQEVGSVSETNSLVRTSSSTNTPSVKIKSLASDQSIDEILAHLKTPILIVVQGIELLVMPLSDTVYTGVNDFDELLKQLKNKPERIEFLDSIDDALYENLSFNYSIKSVIWALSLEREFEFRQGTLSSDGEFCIDSWPPLNEWKSSPALMRLAALYTHKFSTLDEGVEFSKLPKIRVFSFLQACERCGITLRHRHPVEKLNAPDNISCKVSDVRKESPSILGRLRTRLGLAFGRVS